MIYIKTYFSVLHTVTLMNCKARQVSGDLFSSNQGNGSDMSFVSRATKISPKTLKAWRHQWYSDWRVHIVVCIAVLLAMQQFYFTQMMMLIFTIIVMHSYLSSVCWICLILKNTYLKEHPWVIASKYSIYNTENNRNLNYVYCLNLAPVEKALRYQWNIPPWFVAPRVKTWFYNGDILLL